MSRPTPAIIAPAVDLAKIAAECRELMSQITDGENGLAARRLMLGRKLVEARKRFTGRSDGFAQWCEGDAGIKERTARNYMRLAGYVDRGKSFRDPPQPASVPVPDPVPKYIEAGIKKPKQAPPSPPKAKPAESLYGELTLVHPATPEWPLQSVIGPAPKWLAEIESAADVVVKKASAMQSACLHLAALCQANAASISAAEFIVVKAKVLAARTALADVLAAIDGGEQ